nr:uncharacterized protein LOC123770087 [Procambarus clarkii]
MPEKLNKAATNRKRKQLCNDKKSNMDKKGRGIPKKSRKEDKGASSSPKKCNQKSKGACVTPDKCNKEERLVPSVADDCNKQARGVSSAKIKLVNKRKQLTQKTVATVRPSKTVKKPSPKKTPKKSPGHENVEEPTVEADKKTRGQRKKKILHPLTIELSQDDEYSDIDYESPSEEYQPPKWLHDDDDDDTWGDSEEGTKSPKKKKMAKEKDKNNDEQPKKKKQRKTKQNKNREILEKTRRIGTGVKRKRRLIKSRLNTEPEASAFPDMPDLLADDITQSTGGKPKKKKRRLKSNLAKMRDSMNRSTSDQDDLALMEEKEDDIQEFDVLKSRKLSKYGQPYSVTGSWYIASGYLQDLTTLLQLFDDSENWRFKDFAVCWQTLKFSLIYRGRQNFKELLEFSEEVALLTKRFLVPPHSFKWRIGALYTIYGLYYKHPFSCNLANVNKPCANTKVCYQRLIMFYILQMCLDFASTDRDAVDVKYESQRLANASPVSNSLPLQARNIQRHLLEQYMKVKAVAMGDGKEPEKAVRLVQFSLPAEVDSTLKKLKEETLIELGLKELPSSSSVEGKTSNVLSDIGARRAHVRAKALTADTSQEYLHKRGIVSNFVFKGKMGRRVLIKRRLSRPRDEEQDNEVVKINDLSGPGKRKVYKTLESLMEKEVRDFMSPPSPSILSMPLKPREETEEPAHDTTGSTEDLDHLRSDDDADNELAADEEVVADEELEGDNELKADNELAVDGLSEENEVQTLMKNETSPPSNTVENIEEEWFNTVPKVTPRPKRRRGRPRKTALYKALNNSKRNVPIKEKLALLFGNKKGKAKALQELLEVGSSEHDLPAINASNSIQVDAPIIDLPSEQTKLILQVKPNCHVDEHLKVTNLCEAQTMTDCADAIQSGMMQIYESVSLDESFLVLDVHFNKTGTNILRKMKYKIKKTVWESIKKDERKMKSLKKKLLKFLTLSDDSSQADIKSHVSGCVAEGESGENKLSQGLSSQNEHLRYTSPSKYTKKVNAPINSNVQEQVISVPPKQAAKRAWIPKAGKKAKITMVPIKVGGVTHYFPSTPYLPGTPKSKKPTAEQEKVQTTPCVKVTCEVNDYQIRHSNFSEDARAESPDFIYGDNKLMSPLPENETREECYPDSVESVIIHVDAPIPGIDVEIKDDKYNQEREMESPVKLNKMLIKGSPSSPRKQHPCKRAVDQVCIIEDQISKVSDDNSPNSRRTMTKEIKDAMCHKVLQNNTIDLSEEENSVQFVNTSEGNFTDVNLSDMSMDQNSDQENEMSESIGKVHFQEDFSLSQVPLSTSFTFNHSDSAQQSFGQENYPQSAVVKEMQPHPLPCTSVGPISTPGMIVQYPPHSRQIHMCQSSVENSKVALSNSRVAVYSSPTPAVLHINNPLSASNPVSSQHFVVSTDQGHSSSGLDFHGVPHSSPTSILQSPVTPRTLAATVTTTTSVPAVNVNYSNSPLSLLTYQRVPVYPVEGQPTRFLEDQPTHQPGLEISPGCLEGLTYTPLRSSSRIQTTPSPISSVTYASHPNVGECNVVRVKINDNFVYLPVDKVLSNTMSINSNPELAHGNVSSAVMPVEICSASIVSENVEDRDLGVQELNSGSPSKDNFKNYKNSEKIQDANLSPTSILPDRHSILMSPTETVPDYNIKTEDVKLFDSDSVATTSEAYASSLTHFKPKTPQVCSFLFSPKYKALSAMRETIGLATGTPVKKEKPRVPFFLKQSLVPKKRKLS